MAVALEVLLALALALELALALPRLALGWRALPRQLALVLELSLALALEQSLALVLERLVWSPRPVHSIPICMAPQSSDTAFVAASWPQSDDNPAQTVFWAHAVLEVRVSPLVPTSALYGHPQCSGRIEPQTNLK